MGISPSEMMEDINMNGNANGGNSSSDDEVVVGEDDELAGGKGSNNGTSSSTQNTLNEFNESEKASASHSHDMGFFRFETPDNEDLFSERPLPDWVGWSGSSDMQIGGSSVNPFVDSEGSNVDLPNNTIDSVTPDGSSPTSGDPMLPNGSPTTTSTSSEGSAGSDGSQRSVAVPSLFEDDVEFVGVEIEGTEKAMDQALKEGIVGEAGPLKRAITPKAQDKGNSDEGGAGMKEFNDANYWRVDQEVSVLE